MKGNIKNNMKQYYKDNKEKISLQRKQYYKDNKEKIQLHNKQYYQDNKDRINKYTRQYYQDNKEKLKQQVKQYREDNKEKIKQQVKQYRRNPKVIKRLKQYHKQYKQDNKERKNNYNKTKFKNDSNFRIIRLLRTRLGLAFKAYSKNGKLKSSNKYGIDYNAIMEYLKPFPKHRELFHIDHIRPLCSFDFDDPKEIKKAFAPENHQ